MTPEAPAAATESLQETTQPPINRLKDGKFAKGVSGYPAGRPKGAKNHSTRVREALLACVGRPAIRRFKHRLNGASDPAQFEKAVSQVIALLGPSKPLVEIDNSQHTHFTLVLEDDGTSHPQP